MKFKCFPIVMLAVESANDDFSPAYRLVQERVDILKQYCNAVDLLISQRDGDGFDFDVDRTDKTILMSFRLTDIEVFNKEKDLFPQLASRALRFSLEHADNNRVLVSLVYPSLWEEAE